MRRFTTRHLRSTSAAAAAAIASIAGAAAATIATVQAYSNNNSRGNFETGTNMGALQSTTAVADGVDGSENGNSADGYASDSDDSSVVYTGTEQSVGYPLPTDSSEATNCAYADSDEDSNAEVNTNADVNADAASTASSSSDLEQGSSPSWQADSDAIDTEDDSEQEEQPAEQYEEHLNPFGEEQSEDEADVEQPAEEAFVEQPIENSADEFIEIESDDDEPYDDNFLGFNLSGHSNNAADVASPNTPESAESTPDDVPSAPIVAIEDDDDGDGSPPRKRQRQCAFNATTATPVVNIDDGDSDDGLTCSICFEAWQVTGEHRLVSLNCGHIFGRDCVERWLAEGARQLGYGHCPQCKSQASLCDIRPLYAKRVRVLDRSVEQQLKEQLKQKDSEVNRYRSELSVVKLANAQLYAELNTLKQQNETLQREAMSSSEGSQPANSQHRYRLYMHTNQQLSRYKGGRVMCYAKNRGTLWIAQNFGTSLFQGYGVRSFNTNTLQVDHVLHTNNKAIVDMAVADAQGFLAVATMEPTVKLYDLRTIATKAYQPSDNRISSVCFNDYYLYSGTQGGRVFMQDTRGNPREVVKSYEPTDFSHVIGIKSVPVSEKFPSGGILVCKLTSVWFYSDAANATAVCLDISGPFESMNYNGEHNTLLLATRVSARNTCSGYFYGTLEANADGVFFKQITYLTGSSITEVMTRCTQAHLDEKAYVLAYMQDVKKLALFDTDQHATLQLIPSNEVIYDMCPIMHNNELNVATLTESRLKIFKMHDSA